MAWSLPRSSDRIDVVDHADATFLVNETGLTWGDLATHLRKLENAGCVTVDKRIEGRKPRTLISLTPQGRVAFDQYRTNLQAALNDLPREPSLPTRNGTYALSGGWRLRNGRD